MTGYLGLRNLLPCNFVPLYKIFEECGAVYYISVELQGVRLYY
jgi:hypothetical protein